jgi:hypothetical protein
MPNLSEVHTHHGELFALALAVFACSAALLVLHRRDLPLIGG